MATTQRARSSRRSSTPGSDPASLGLIMVVIALVLGVILLVKGGAVGFDKDETSVDIGSGTQGENEQTTTTTAAPPSTVAPASVKVVAANGSGTSGLAKKTTEAVGASGYTNTVATDASADATASAVYFAPGFEENAKAIAASLGLPASSVQAMPASPVAKDQPADAGVVILLGSDAPPLIDAAGSTTTAPPAGQTTTTTA
jgi:hypothetical protein